MSITICFITCCNISTGKQFVLSWGNNQTPQGTSVQANSLSCPGATTRHLKAHQYRQTVCLVLGQQPDTSRHISTGKQFVLSWGNNQTPQGTSVQANSLSCSGATTRHLKAHQYRQTVCLVLGQQPHTSWCD